MLGEQVASWLREHVNPSWIYDHRMLTTLPAGITYLPDAHLLYMFSGEIVAVPTYTPAELMKHPVIEFRGLTDGIDTRWIPGFEIAHVLHLLLWPSETPPGDPRHWIQAFEMDVLSIADRGVMPYRDTTTRRTR